MLWCCSLKHRFSKKSGRLTFMEVIFPSWQASCNDRRNVYCLIVWLLPFTGFTMEMKHKEKSTGNLPMFKSVRVHHWQQIWAFKASLKLGFSFTVHIDFCHCWVRHISTLTQQLTVKHTDTHSQHTHLYLCGGTHWYNVFPIPQT